MPETPEGTESVEPSAKKKSHHSPFHHHDDEKKSKKKRPRSMRIREVTSSIKEAVEDVGHHLHLHDHAAPAQDEKVELLQVPATPEAVTVLPQNSTVEKRAKKEKRKSHRRSVEQSHPAVEDAVSQRKVDEESEAVSKQPFVKKYSKKTADEKLTKFFDALEQSQETVKPAPQLVECLSSGVNLLMPLNQVIKDGDHLLIDSLARTVDELKLQVDQAEAVRPEYKVDVDLLNAKNMYRERSDAYEASFTAEEAQYNARIEALTRKIADIDQQKMEITADAVLEKLTKLTVYQEFHQKIDENIRATGVELANRSCAQRMFFCFPTRAQKQLGAEMQRLELQRAMLNDHGQMDAIKKTLMDKLNADREAAVKESNELIDKQPQRDNKASSRYIEVEAEVSQRRDDYYHRVNTTVMSLLVKVMNLLDKISQKIPRPSIVEADPANHSADHFFCRLIDGLRDRVRQRLEAFYSLTPGRYSFRDFEAQQNEVHRMSMFAAPQAQAAAPLSVNERRQSVG